jgi:hypothetical protein
MPSLRLRTLVALACLAAVPGVTRADGRARDFVALCDATRAGDPARVGDLLARGVDPRHSPESSEDDASYHASLCDPVQNAVEAGDAASLDLLLSHGANPDWLCCDGPPALGRALERGRPDLARALLDAGADPVGGLWPAIARHEWALAARLTGGTARSLFAFLSNPDSFAGRPRWRARLLAAPIWGALVAPPIAFGLTLRRLRAAPRRRRLSLSVAAGVTSSFAFFALSIAAATLAG